MKKTVKVKSVVDQLRDAIEDAEKRGITRSQMALEVNMPRSQFNRIAGGESVPRLDTAERIFSMLEMPLQAVPNKVQYRIRK